MVGRDNTLGKKVVSIGIMGVGALLLLMALFGFLNSANNPSGAQASGAQFAFFWLVVFALGGLYLLGKGYGRFRT